jgi:hypothetical protein
VSLYQPYKVTHPTVKLGLLLGMEDNDPEALATMVTTAQEHVLEVKHCLCGRPMHVKMDDLVVSLHHDCLVREMMRRASPMLGIMGGAATFYRGGKRKKRKYA